MNRGKSHRNFAAGPIFSVEVNNSGKCLPHHILPFFWSSVSWPQRVKLALTSLWYFKHLIHLCKGNIPPIVVKIFEPGYHTGRPFVCYNESSCPSFVDTCHKNGNLRLWVVACLNFSKHNCRRWTFWRMHHGVVVHPDSGDSQPSLHLMLSVLLLLPML